MSSTPDAAQSAFATRIASLLKGRDSATVAAAELTDFAWSTLCFERDDTLLLKFDGQSPVVFKLRYEDYYVDEAHVARSLDGQCVTPTDRIVVRRKYPGHPAPIEFQQADSGSATQTITPAPRASSAASSRRPTAITKNAAAKSCPPTRTATFAPKVTTMRLMRTGMHAPADA